MSGHEEEPRLSAEDERFVERLGALYRPPEPTAAARARFAARLDARIARGGARRPWLLAGAAAAALAALVFALRPAEEPARLAVEETTPAAAESVSTDEALLLLANGPLADPDEELPDDYQTLASLLE
jgi:hypothetical protein